MAQPMLPNIEQLERTVALYRGLVEVSVLINSISDFEELLSQILDVAGRVMRAEASSLFLIDETSGDLELAIARGPVGTELPRRAKVPRGYGFVGWVREHRKSLLVTDAYQDPRFYSELDKTTGFITRSVLCIPLLQGDQELGVLEVLNPIDKDHFDPVDLEAFEVYGSLAATAIARVRAVEQERQRRELERDLSLATEIQHSFLPRRLPVTGQVAFAAQYRPAREIAGDFYDVFALDDETFDFVIGDVSGKGVSAALMMAQAVSMLRLIVNPENSPTVGMRSWNDWL
jgi:sigma-B regulation protein RsbU (phosphoserine phosphatase)